MILSDWILVAGLAAAALVWGYAVSNQWSNRPGAMKRMVAGCAVFGLILLTAIIAANMME